jgi:hypothetical protein
MTEMYADEKAERRKSNSLSLSCVLYLHNQRNLRLSFFWLRLVAELSLRDEYSSLSVSGYFFVSPKISAKKSSIAFHERFAAFSLYALPLDLSVPALG